MSVISNANVTLVPAAFAWLVDLNDIGGDACGFAIPTVQSGCCWGSYDPEGSDGYLGMMVSPATDASDDEFEFWTPTTAVGKTYCKLSLPDDETDLFVYRDNSCQNGMRCFTDNSGLAIYNDTDCAWGEELLEIGFAGESLTLGQAANVTELTIAVGQQAFRWNGYFPFEYDIVYMNSPFRIVASIVVFLGMSTSLISFAWVGYRLSQSNRFIYKALMLSQVLEAIGSVAMIYYYYFPSPSITMFYVLDEICFAMQAMASIILNLLNLEVLFTVIESQLWNTRTKKTIVSALFVVIHLVFDWPAYAGYVLDSPLSSELINSWYGQGGAAWYLISLLVNAGCVFYIVIGKIAIKLKTTSNSRKLPGLETLCVYLIQNEQPSFLLLIAVITNILFYVFVAVVANYSLILGGDIEMQLFQLLQWNAFPINGLLTVWLLEVTTSPLSSRNISKGSKTNAQPLIGSIKAKLSTRAHK
ncbi:hypothetical protein HDV03_000659 [Kappamyces sp. JEL0829]|nr:hypothetical protein HDV03_000659 [Kappamyces sp. JEL0829]